MNIVTAAIIISNGKVLIAQREGESNLAYKWEFPGGKLEKGETPDRCIIREIKEELNMMIEPIEVFKTVSFRHKEKDMILMAYICRHIEGEGEPLECNDFKWVSKDELDKYEYTPVDKSIVEKLKNDVLIN